MRDEIADEMLPIETRVRLLEAAATATQNRLQIDLGRCVNAGLHPETIHPHWDSDYITEVFGS